MMDTHVRKQLEIQKASEEGSEIVLTIQEGQTERGCPAGRTV